MTKRVGRRSIEAIETESRELVKNAMALNPKLPAANLLAVVLDMAEPDYLADLDGMLRGKHFLRTIRAERVHELREKRAAEWHSPKVRSVMLKLPVRIPIGGGKTIPRRQFEYSHIGPAEAELNRGDLDRHKNNPKLQALEELRALWPKEKRARRMTAAQLDLFL